MNYKILKIVTMDFEEVYALYEKKPELKSYSYHNQKKYFFELRLMLNNHFSENMKILGNDAHDIIVDIEHLQKTWARENGVSFDDDDWRIPIMLKQIEHYKPDVLYFWDCHSLPHSLRAELKRRFPFIKLVTMFKGFPGAFSELKDVDLLFTGAPNMVEDYRKEGINSHLMYHCFDEEILKLLENDSQTSPVYDFTFVGCSGFGYFAGHYSRYWMLVDLLKRTKLEAWIKEWLRFKSVINEFKGTYPDKFIPMKPLWDIFPQRLNKPVFGLDMYRLLYRSKISLNIHADANFSVGNMRMFEATGVGSLLLTDTRKNMPDLFEADKEVVTYSNVDECIEKVNYLLEHEDVRKEIAVSGQKRTLKDHSLRKRCEFTHHLISKTLSTI